MELSIELEVKALNCYRTNIFMVCFKTYTLSSNFAESKVREAATWAWKCSVKNCPWKLVKFIENTSAGVYFRIQLHARGQGLYSTKGAPALHIFMWILPNFSERPICRILANGCFWSTGFKCLLILYLWSF